MPELWVKQHAHSLDHTVVTPEPSPEQHVTPASGATIIHEARHDVEWYLKSKRMPVSTFAVDCVPHVVLTIRGVGVWVRVPQQPESAVAIRQSDLGPIVATVFEK